MALVFPDYEQASQKNKTNITPEISTHGYIEVKLEQDPPIFSKVRMNFNPSDKITHMNVSNNYIVLAMANHMLFRIDLLHPDKHEEISLTKPTASKLSNIFLDPLGQHILLSFIALPPDNSIPELLYLSRKSVKPKPTVRCRGHEITAVGWNYENKSETSTGSILLGTSKGLIFETEISQEGDKFFQSSLEQYWKQVFDIGKGTNTPITGIQFHRVPKTDNYFIIVTTLMRLYYFVGRSTPDDKPLLQQLFNLYLNVPETNFHQIQNKSKYSKLKFWCDKNDSTPKAFGWLTEEGIYYSQLNPENLEKFDLIKKNAKIITLPTLMYENVSQSQKQPIDFVLTEFHCLLAYNNVLKGVSVLNKELVFEDNYSGTFGKVINIIKDPIKGTVWVVSESAIFRYKITKEERDVWKIYCDAHEFELAKMYSIDNPAHYDQVLVKEADMLFANKHYEMSAERYAETQSSFEEICLKFLEFDSGIALKLYLKKKLENLKPQDKTQITMIVLWVVELFLSQLAQMRSKGMELTTRYSELQKEFDTFLILPQVVQCIKNNKSTIYDLMASHGDKHNVMKLTIINKDFEQVIRQHIYKNSYLDALEVLKSQNRRDLFYQFSPILMQEIPRQTVNALIAQGRNLLPVKLLPALVSCEDYSYSNETIRYLEFCVHSLGCNERAIHNLLLSLYANTKSEKLMPYLATQGQDISMVCYDVHFALRLCRENHLLDACVQLSALLGLWESAVDLALQIDVELAKQTANRPQNDNELRRKLWLKIAQHVISGKEDIEQAMKFLQQCDLLRIEDVLEFFSDFVIIDHFKEAICQSIQECNQHIQDLKEEMHEATESAERVRGEIQSFRNRYTLINMSDVCSICDLMLVARAFYLFPCGHRFHADCLLTELTPNIGPAKRNKLHDLNKQLTMLSCQVHNDNISTSSASLSMRDQVKQDIDNIVASECLYCGELMIRNIDRPFIDEKDYEKIFKEWE